MKLLLYGVSGNTVSLEDRDKYLVNEETAAQHLSDLRQYEGVEGIILLTNAFRTEYYLHVDETVFSHGDFLRYLSDYSGKAIGDVILETYSKFNADAIRHLLYVLAGMDSEEEDESEVMKNAEAALEASRKRGDFAGVILEMLFEKAVSFSSQMQSLPSMAPLHKGNIGAVVRTFVNEWQNLENKRFLLAGQDADVSHIAKTLYRMGARHITIANLERKDSESVTEPLNRWAMQLGEQPAKRVFIPVDVHHFLYNLSSCDGIVVASEQFQSIMTEHLSNKIKEIRPYKKKQMMIDLSQSIREEFIKNASMMTVFLPDALLSSETSLPEEEETARKVFEESVELESENFFSWYQTLVDQIFPIQQPIVIETKKIKTYQ